MTRNMKRRPPRTNPEIMREVLEKINQTPKMRRRKIAETCEINFMKACDITDKLQRAKMITRAENGEYEITETGIASMKAMIEHEYITRGI
jgi:predicted transcriptional regulator